MNTKTVDVHEAEVNFKELLSLVMNGTEITLVEGNRALARLMPIRTTGSRRIPGLHAGLITVNDDFDEPLPDEFWLGTT